MSKLKNGEIPAGTTCPFVQPCGGGKCPAPMIVQRGGFPIENDFSCGLARALDITHKWGKED